MEYNIIDTYPYILLYIVLLLSTIINTKRSSIIAFLALLGFVSVRSGIGYDYNIYKEIIESNSVFNWEWLSNIIAEFARKTKNTQSFFIINSAVALFPVAYMGRKLSKNCSLVLFSYFLIPLFFLDSMSIVRNASAYSLVFLSFYFFDTRRYFVTIVLCLIAMGFHNSAFIAVGVYLVIIFVPRNLTINNVFYVFAVFFMFFDVSNVLVDLFSPLLPDPVGSRFQLYGLSDGVEQGRFMKYILFFIGFVNLRYYRKLHLISVKSDLYILLYTIGLLIWGVFSFDHTLSLRLSSYFFLFFILLVPIYSKINFYKNSIKGFYVLILFLSLFFISSFVVNINAYNNKETEKVSFLPYSTIFNN